MNKLTVNTFSVDRDMLPISR